MSADFPECQCETSKRLRKRIQELERQITEAREFLTEWASHNPQIERVLVEARQKLKPIRPFNGGR